MCPLENVMQTNQSCKKPHESMRLPMLGVDRSAVHARQQEVVSRMQQSNRRKVHIGCLIQRLPALSEAFSVAVGFLHSTGRWVTAQGNPGCARTAALGDAAQRAMLTLCNRATEHIP
jgi:hypothetical protein